MQYVYNNLHNTEMFLQTQRAAITVYLCMCASNRPPARCAASSELNRYLKIDKGSFDISLPLLT